jgi:hypothetical protein
MFVGAGHDITAGLVKEKSNRRGSPDRATLDTHIVIGSDKRREIVDAMAVDYDSAGGDQLLAGTPRAKASGGKKTIQPHGKRRKINPRAWF